MALVLVLVLCCAAALWLCSWSGVSVSRVLSQVVCFAFSLVVSRFQVL